jgi:ribose transport system ATP-binding protein
MYLGHERRFSRAGLLSPRALISRTRSELREIIGREIPPNAFVADLPWGERQILEIVRAVAAARLLDIETPLILLDEPTAAMTHDELEDFFALLRRLREQTIFETVSFIFVSHRLEEILNVSDRIYVLKDGVIVSEVEGQGVTERELHALMVGRQREERYYRQDLQRSDLGEVVVELENVACPPYFESVSFEVRAGEILGIGGVTGAGNSELGRAIAGLLPVSSGTILLNGRDVTNLSIARRIDAGIGYVPVDRHEEGLILYHSVAENMTLASLDLVTRGPGVLSVRRERAIARQAISRFGVMTRNERALVATLSGGNQQKVVMAKALLGQPKLIMFDNPTRGVDAGAKYELYGLIRELAARDVAIIVLSADLPELIALSNRILVMKDRRIRYACPAPVDDKPSEHEIVEHMV